MENDNVPDGYDQFALVMPYMEGGNLKDLCYNKAYKVPVEDKIKFCLQAAKGVCDDFPS